MTTITGRTSFARPVEEVFDLLADPRNEPRYNPLVVSAVMATPEPVGVGSRFVQRAGSFGRTGEVAIEVVEYVRLERLAFVIRSAGIDVRGRLAFSPEPSGCSVSWTWAMRPVGGWRVLTPLLALTGRRLERRVWDRMRRYVDAGGAVRPAAG